jgi:hypothetical protein
MKMNFMPDTEMQKITVEVPKALLSRLKEYTGGGTTESVRKAMEDYNRRQAQKALLNLRGSMKERTVTLEEMRSWEENDPLFKATEKFHGNEHK